MGMSSAWQEEAASLVEGRSAGLPFGHGARVEYHVSLVRLREVLHQGYVTRQAASARRLFGAEPQGSLERSQVSGIQSPAPHRAVVKRLANLLLAYGSYGTRILVKP